MGSQVESQIQNCPNWAQQTFPAYWKSSHRKGTILQCEGCSTWISSQILEHRYPIWQSWKIYQPPCKSTYHKSQWLTDDISCTYTTAHISLGHLECHWKSFNRQMDKTHQLLQFLSWQPSTPTELLATLQVELTNINDIYTPYKPIIIPAINHLNTDPSFDGHSNHNNHLRRSLLPFLGDAPKLAHGNCNYKRC